MAGILSRKDREEMKAWLIKGLALLLVGVLALAGSFWA